MGPANLFPGSEHPEAPRTWHEATRAFQRELLLQTLTEANWNVSQAAERLDLARSYVYELIRAFELTRP